MLLTNLTELSLYSDTYQLLSYFTLTTRISYSHFYPPLVLAYLTLLLTFNFFHHCLLGASELCLDSF